MLFLTVSKTLTSDQTVTPKSEPCLLDERHVVSQMQRAAKKSTEALFACHDIVVYAH